MTKSKLEQPKKASVSILVILSGIITAAKYSHSAKADAPIVVIPFGISNWKIGYEPSTETNFVPSITNTSAHLA